MEKTDNKSGRQITHEGELKIGELTIPCFVLKDGTRVISGRGMQEALRIREVPEEGEKRGGYILPKFLQSKALKPFIDNKLGVAKLEPIICYRGNITYHGYEGTVMADLCDAILDARASGVPLTERQRTVANQSEIIMRALARVGIIALIDEATGYVKDKNRAKDELQKFLNQFMREEAAKLVKRFEDSFFEMIYKMRGWTWNYTHKHPGVVGVWINDIVYERIAPLVLSELKKKNPVQEGGGRKNKHHQFLSEEVGVPKLLNHLAAVEALGRASGYNWNKFMVMLDTAFPKQYQQLNLIFDEPADVENTPTEKPSDFNQKLTTALNYNPKETPK